MHHSGFKFIKGAVTVSYTHLRQVPPAPPHPARMRRSRRNLPTLFPARMRRSRRNLPTLFPALSLIHIYPWDVPQIRWTRK